VKGSTAYWRGIATRTLSLPAAVFEFRNPVATAPNSGEKRLGACDD